MKYQSGQPRVTGEEHLSPGIGKLRAQCDERHIVKTCLSSPQPDDLLGTFPSFMCVATSRKLEACSAMICLLVRIYMLNLSFWCLLKTCDAYVYIWCDGVKLWQHESSSVCLCLDSGITVPYMVLLNIWGFSLHGGDTHFCWMLNGHLKYLEI